MQADHSSFKSGGIDDFQLHGQITHEMRGVAKGTGIPILTISQNTRGSDDASQIQTNNNMGGSIKKIRYADTIIMIRQDPNIDIQNQSFMRDVGMSNIQNSKVPMSMAKNTGAFEVSITKNKNGDRGNMMYHIFSKDNLRIYSDAVVYLQDMKQCQKKSDDMKRKLDSLEFSNSTIDDDLDLL